MGSDLSCFVPTDAYRLALNAIHAHQFVLLLGDAASGKSTIAAILALGALDDGCLGALKINSPDQLNVWHPGERQFLWVDDAFGPNQFDAARMSRWNAELGTLRAAIEGGARIVFTSRSYIWEAARPHLKMSAFPLLKASQVVVNVHALSNTERAQMLYNHVRRVQPRIMRQRLKPLLPEVATNAAFLPETARRLGDPLFTQDLKLSAARLKQLVEHPVEFLTEVIEQLDDASRAAIALIFLNSETGVPSPILPGPAADMVGRLTGVPIAEISKAMQFHNDSLTRLISRENGDYWVFRHPTVTDAFSELVGKSPELIELYVTGAKLDRLIREVHCRPRRDDEKGVRVPASLYPILVERLRTYSLDESLSSFLGARCERKFLAQMLDARVDILMWAEKVSFSDIFYGGRLLLAALASYKLLPESSRLRIVQNVEDHSLTWLDARPLEDKIIRQIFTDEEFVAYTLRFRKEWLENLPDLFDTFNSRFSSEEEASMFAEFRDNLRIAQRCYGFDDEDEAFSEVYAQIDSHIEELEAAREDLGLTGWTPLSVEKGSDAAITAASDTIFEDVDD